MVLHGKIVIYLASNKFYWDILSLACQVLPSASFLLSLNDVSYPKKKEKKKIEKCFFTELPLPTWKWKIYDVRDWQTWYSHAGKSFSIQLNWWLFVICFVAYSNGYKKNTMEKELVNYIWNALKIIYGYFTSEWREPKM